MIDYPAVIPPQNHRGYLYQINDQIKNSNLSEIISAKSQRTLKNADDSILRAYRKNITDTKLEIAASHCRTNEIIKAFQDQNRQPVFDESIVYDTQANVQSTLNDEIEIRKKETPS